MADDFDGRVPDWVIHPTAGGTGIYAMWKGFKELLSLGWIDRAPKLAAAQSEAAAPIVAAFERGAADVAPVVARETIAESIQVGNPVSLGWRALAALRESNGAATALSDQEILEAQALTGSLAGIFAEPAAAASVAAARVSSCRCDRSRRDCRLHLTGRIEERRGSLHRKRVRADRATPPPWANNWTTRARSEE